MKSHNENKTSTLATWWKKFIPDSKKVNLQDEHTIAMHNMFVHTQPSVKIPSAIKSLPRSILVTGANGFLGKPLVQKLAKEGFVVYALDILPPTESFRQSLSQYSNVHFVTADIAIKKSLIKAFANKIDFVFHLGAFWSFDTGYRNIYERVNLKGTENLLDLADSHGVKRVIFTSSISGLTPKPNEIITETTPPDPNTSHPYGWSKARNELSIQKRFEKPTNTKVSIVRLSGVYDPVRCELPPLSTVMNRWHTWSPLGRIIPGKGNTGFGYLHIDDFVAMMLKIIKKHEHLDRCEILMATPADMTSHNALFEVIRKSFGLSTKPLHVPVALVKFGFKAETFVRAICGLKAPIEKEWMFDLVDRPYLVDPKETFRKLEWQPLPERHLLKTLPTMVQAAKIRGAEWNKIQDDRMVSNYLRWQEQNKTIIPTIDSNSSMKLLHQRNIIPIQPLSKSLYLIASKFKDKRFCLFAAGVVGAVALGKTAQHIIHSNEKKKEASSSLRIGK